jgi:putative membrane protein
MSGDAPRPGPVVIDLSDRPHAPPATGEAPLPLTERVEAPRRDGPVTVEDLPPAPSPADAPPVDDDDAPTGEAMRTLAVLSNRRGSSLGTWALGLAGALISFAATVALYEFVAGLLERNAVLGWIATGLTAAFAAVLLAIALREWAAFARLARLDDLHREADAARASADLTAARDVARRLTRLYADRPALEIARREVEARIGDVMDAQDLLRLCETRLLVPLDAAASREVEAAARQVAAVTALVPIAFADLAAALASNLRMIRRIAEVYGGRSGRLGTVRLTRAVFAHLVATGAVAVGEDLGGAVAGGSLLTRVSRRFGEGVVNGALTARVGVAAMEVCRPMPFHAVRRPSVAGVAQRALTGVMTRD